MQHEQQVSDGAFLPAPSDAVPNDQLWRAAIRAAREAAALAADLRRQLEQEAAQGPRAVA